MQNEISLIMEEIEKNPERLKQMLRIKKIDELYQFFTENGYKQSFERFKEEVNSLRESLKSKLQEDSDLENVAGGINIKNKLTKTTSIGLASLLALGSPVGYASNPKVPNKPMEQNTLTKKLLKYITVGGIGATAFATAWGYNKYFGGGKKPKQTRVNEEPAKAEKQPEEETNSYDKLQDDISSDELTKPDQDEGSGTQSTKTEDLPIEEKEGVKEEISHDDEPAPMQPEPVMTGGVLEPKDKMDADKSLTEDEQLIKDVLGENACNAFKLMEKSYRSTETNAASLVVLAVKEIQRVLGDEANNLGRFAHNSVRIMIGRNHSSNMFFRYICSALDGYICGGQQPLMPFGNPSAHANLNALIVSCGFLNHETCRKKIEKVKECINWMRNNVESFRGYRENNISHLLPNEAIDAIWSVINNSSASLENWIFCLSRFHIGLFAYLIAKLPELEDGSFRISTFRYNDSCGFCFEIVKNDQSIGEFKYIFDNEQETATLKRLTGDNAGVEYTYDFDRGDIKTQQPTTLTDVSNVQDEPLPEAETTPQPGR